MNHANPQADRENRRRIEERRVRWMSICVQLPALPRAPTGAVEVALESKGTRASRTNIRHHGVDER